MNEQLRSFVEMAPTVVPSWPIQVVSHIDASWTDFTPEGVGALATELARQYPGAGPHYCSFRTLSLVAWQPVYVTMAAVHLNNLCLTQECIGQRMDAGVGWGCRIANHQPLQGKEQHIVECAAAALKAGLDALVNCVEAIGVRRTLASRLLADCVTGATLAIQRRRSDWTIHRTREWGERWLETLDLADAGGFWAFHDRTGRPQLAMERKICCLAFRANAKHVCDTCPRLSVSDRLQRLQGDPPSATSHCP